MIIKIKKNKLSVMAIAVLLVASLAIGCTPKSVPVSFDAEGDIPASVREIANEFVQNMITSYKNELGNRTSEAMITSLKKVGTSELRDSSGTVEVWLLEYRLLPKIPENVILVGGMQLDDGWITEWGSTGQPLIVVYHESGAPEDNWEWIAISETLTVDEEYDGDFAKAGMAIYNRSLGSEQEYFDQQAAQNELIDEYDSQWIYDLYNSDGSMNVGLYIQGDGQYNTYTVTDGWNAERYDVLMGSYIWTYTESDKFDNSIYNDAPYCITIQSSDGQHELTFVGEAGFARYKCDGLVLWYKLTYKYGDYGTTYYLAADMRAEYDNLDVNFENIAFKHHGTPEEAAELFVYEAYASNLLGLAPCGWYSITDYAVVDWGIMDVSEDKTAVVGWFSYAVMPETYDSPGLWAGNTQMGEGEYEGWLVMYRQFVLQRKTDEYWYCIGFGTGGYNLPEDADNNMGDDEVTKKLVGFNSILTYENDGYNGSETGCDYEVLDVVEQADVEIPSNLENTEMVYLPSKIVGDDATPLARMFFNVGYLPDSISFRAHGPDSPDGEFDILLETEVFDEKSWLLTLPVANGRYYLIADCYWPDGISKAITFSVEVS